MAGVVVFLDPFTGKIATMPDEMIAAYVHDGSFLKLEEAARKACIRDVDAANNLLLSIVENSPIAEADDEVTAEPQPA